jgi:two-component system response regulator NreC
VTIRVFIADDHAILRSGLRAFIGAQPDMQVVGEAANATDAESGINETEPDVALMDISMPGGGGIAAIAAVTRINPKTRVVVLTGHDQPGYLRAAAEAGAVGYVVKTAVDRELLAAIRAVAQGGTFMTACIEEGAAKTSPTPKQATAANGGRTSHLSKRELQVMVLVAEGNTNSEIADQLRLEVDSIEACRSGVMEKLNLTSRADLVRFVLECGSFTASGPARQPG